MEKTVTFVRLFMGDTGLHPRRRISAGTFSFGLLEQVVSS